MALFVVSVLVATAILSFLPSGQQLIERLTRGAIKSGAMPWLGIGTTFMWTYAVMPNPASRGVAFGVLILSIASILKWWAPRDENVKHFIRSAFFAGRDIWGRPNFNLTVGALFGAGLVLLLPFGGMDRFLNLFGLMGALAWLAWQAYKGDEDSNETVVDDSSAESA